MFLEGDLFFPLTKLPSTVLSTPSFNLIIFNPPYLPSEEEIINHSNRQPIDAAWDGGNTGDELLLRFLTEVPKYLASAGEIVFVSSSLVDQTKLLEALETQGFSLIQTEKIHIFFEDILCYHAILNN